MAWDPKKLISAPPRYQPLENDPDDDSPPAYDDDDNAPKPKFKDLVKVARLARKGLKP